ncbi:unnamed protein product [Rhizophagus irregularis]|nr:unnamed protein product [Rhizophagus irregularis]
MKDFLRQLKLMTNLGFPYTRRDESEIKRKAKAMTRKDTNKRSQKVTSNKELKILLQDVTKREKLEKKGKERRPQVKIPQKPKEVELILMKVIVNEKFQN